MLTRRFYATYRDTKYRNPNGTMTMAAIRARQPYALRNALLGLGMLSFAVGTYMWAYQSFTPDDFSDVPVPPLSEEELARLRKEYGLDKK
ncbi:Cytochrome c oxidase assembly factor 3, mitochondrial [Wickerhamiella sorbophila]|uniref:Cytochrome c oxidase assembly factor 3 n=1 Tax=Wickerhamiella sorbophila TaxID=45607 RepID=A0A2T0FJ50_9ASCO|nr:Cytochrome c oxidase assembly factor 3, mitochondrial [Wickerhamiella sorbophila]PRT55034.1 Cytochrome c oxidase assembly factor 3, mitochondrial [Wickerhamiella sorbophila]